MKWFLAVARVVFLLCLGMTLFLAPWGSLWHENFLVMRYTCLSVIGHNYFVQGAISGLGLTNIWLAIDEIHRLGKLSNPVPTRFLR
jgi:antibiotic biosynthesis monooxygenase (ABM) superfamily enzyme